MTGCFNLVDEPWLPVTLAEDFPGRDERGAAPRVSLREAFEQGTRILDLRCYPHERIALMRLLICIAQRALKGPENEDDWKSCRTRLADAAVRYLESHRECFNLFGDGPRFMQAQGLRPQRDDADPVSIDKLSLMLAAGSTTTLCDNAGGSKRQHGPAEVAVALVTYQVCSPGGLIGIASWNGQPTGESKASRHALGARNSAIHAFLLGANLSCHIHSNLMHMQAICGEDGHASGWGEPVWEHPPRNPQDTRFCHTYLGRLIPYSRAVWIMDDGRDAIVANGLPYDFYPEGPRDPHITVVLREQTPVALRGRVDRSLWRELHSIAVCSPSCKASGPLQLGHIDMFGGAFRLWTGAVLTKSDSDAKVIDCMQSAFTLPSALVLRDDTGETTDPRSFVGANGVYRQGVEFAEGRASTLRKSVFIYHRALADDLGKKQNMSRGRVVQGQAATRYWTSLEQRAERVLLRDVAMHAADYWTGDGSWLAKSPWGKEVARAAREAYDFACPHTTPRQLHAYAVGLRTLFREDADGAKRKTVNNANEHDSEDEEAS